MTGVQTCVLPIWTIMDFCFLLFSVFLVVALVSVCVCVCMCVCVCVCVFSGDRPEVQAGLWS